ncbi:hypothetical protein EJB05_07275 [Eragrostis curvula]|uniref:Uncharacterized protein n=1 Tax=Eragrostis curvula TaxID=38414 RepID=A0A5J9WHA8_9POAL|nr:hypothetical protein EJB05_07275 [Eragrostis curvula]
MGLFGKSTSKQTAKVKSLVKLAAARLAVARRPRLGRRSIARGDVAQLLAIGQLDRALVRAEQLIEEDNMLEVLDIIERYCTIIIEQSAQLDNPKECSEEIKAAAAGLMFASARLGELPELLDARAILADKFGRDFAGAAKEGSHDVVDPTLVRKLSGEKASLEEKRRLAREIAAENDILLDFPEKKPVEVAQQRAPVQGKQSEKPKNAPVKEFVERSEVKADRHEVQGRQRFVDANARPGLAQLSVDEKVSRDSKKYFDARMAAEAAFESASFAAMAARAAVELSRSQTQGKGPRGGGGYDKVHPHPVVQRQSSAQQKSPSPSPSGSDRSTVTSVGSGAAHKGKGVASDQSDEEEEDVVVWPPHPQRQPTYRRAASAMSNNGGGAWRGDIRANGAAGTRPLQNAAAPDSNPPHRRRATEFGGGGGDARAHGVHDAPAAQRGQYVAPPYRRSPTTAAAREGGGGTHESSAAHAHPPYARIVSALERGKNSEHIARHEEVRRMGTDARAMQERVYGTAAPGQGQGRAPLNPERRANSVRTR